MIDLIAQGDADNIASKNLSGLDKKSLMALKALVDDRLAAFDTSPAVEEPKESTPALTPTSAVISTPEAVSGEEGVERVDGDMIIDGEKTAEADQEVDGDKDVEMSG